MTELEHVLELGLIEHGVDLAEPRGKVAGELELERHHATGCGRQVGADARDQSGLGEGLLERGAVVGVMQPRSRDAADLSRPWSILFLPPRSTRRHPTPERHATRSPDRQ